jgi:hypothetical protein
MENLPTYISVAFVITTVVTLWLLYRASGQSVIVLVGSLVWLALTAVISSTGFFLNTSTLPPRFLFLIGPPLILLVTLFNNAKSKKAIDGFNPIWMTYLHTIRIPVELILFGLFAYGYIPQLMTFEGGNVDIFSGLTAPVFAYVGMIKKKFSNSVLLIWNFICVGLLINIVTRAILSAPFTFQQLAFDQPNVGVFYFPFVWLPAFIVPAVLFCHVASIRLLMINRNE